MWGDQWREETNLDFGWLKDNQDESGHPAAWHTGPSLTTPCWLWVDKNTLKFIGSPLGKDTLGLYIEELQRSDTEEDLERIDYNQDEIPKRKWLARNNKVSYYRGSGFDVLMLW